MANQEHLDILKQGVDGWNQWREEHPEIYPDLRETSLIGANLRRANFSKTDLTGVDLRKAYLRKTNFEGTNLKDANLEYANLRRAKLGGANLEGTNTNLRRTNISRANLKGTNLRRTNLRRANLSNADLTEAHLEGADLTGVNFEGANLTEAHLEGANLTGATFVDTNLIRATLTQCFIYGISIWNVQLEGARQDNLVITPKNEPIITVDNLKIAQLIYLLLNNKEIRDVIDTITSKVVLILGRFTLERKTVLDALREELRHRNYLPIVFDFDIPKNRDITETVSLLARMSRFVIADLTEARSIPQELATIIPDLPSVPVQPILLATEREYSMFEHFKRFPWVLQDYLYTSIEGLLAALKVSVIDPAEQKAQELAKR